MSWVSKHYDKYILPTIILNTRTFITNALNRTLTISVYSAKPEPQTKLFNSPKHILIYKLTPLSNNLICTGKHVDNFRLQIWSEPLYKLFTQTHRQLVHVDILKHGISRVSCMKPALCKMVWSDYLQTATITGHPLPSPPICVESLQDLCEIFIQIENIKRWLPQDRYQ